MSQPRTGLSAECPECDSVIQFSRKPKLGTFVVCDECGETLEVTNVSPIQFSWAFDDDEYDDLDEFDDYEEDDDYDIDDYDDEYEDEDDDF